MKDARLI